MTNTRTTAERAFVVQLDAGCRPLAGQLSGRVQHLSSVDSGHFESLQELVELLDRMLRRRDEEIHPTR